MMALQAFHVQYRYPVMFTQQAFHLGNPTFRQVLHLDGVLARALVIIDDGVARAHPDLLAQIQTCSDAGTFTLVAPPQIVPGGEPIKTDPNRVASFQELMLRTGLCRHSYVISVGGGAVLDAVGYAAAMVHRGVRLVRLPTTTLAQGDSGVGVKNSVNAFGIKNALGTFAPPFAVVNDATFLSSLADRDWLGGVAEAVKVALIKDAAFFTLLETQAEALCRRDLAAMQTVVARCATLHLQHIATAGDPFEQGTSRPLDFGHWAAHKLEALSEYRLRHGEAVAIGMALDTTYAHLAGLLPGEAWQRVLALLQRLRLPIITDELFTPALGEGLDEFRTHLGGRLTIPLLRGIGDMVEVHAMDAAILAQSLAYLRNYAESSASDGTTACHYITQR
ncbi:MAG: 3-dehydroquinate synthase [Armatimonadota bacterium]